jgi:hypothetical protein
VVKLHRLLTLPLRWFRGFRASPESPSVPYSHAPKIPHWALFIGVDADGAVYAFDSAPWWYAEHWRCQRSVDRRKTLDTADIDWPKLSQHRVPHMRAALYVLPEPAANFLRR